MILDLFPGHGPELVETYRSLEWQAGLAPRGAPGPTPAMEQQRGPRPESRQVLQRLQRTPLIACCRLSRAPGSTGAVLATCAPISAA